MTANASWRDDTENVTYPFDASPSPEPSPESGQGGGFPPPPLMLKAFLIVLVELGSFFVHSLLYAQAMPIGRDIFVWSILGVVDPPFLPDIDIPMVLSSMLAILAVGLPIVIWSLLLRNYQSILADPRGFFTRPLNLPFVVVLGSLYAVILLSEASVIWARVSIELGAGASAIPDPSGEPTSVFTVLMLSIALVVANSAFGMASAWIFNQISRARGEV